MDLNAVPASSASTSSDSGGGEDITADSNRARIPGRGSLATESPNLDLTLSFFQPSPEEGRQPTVNHAKRTRENEQPKPSRAGETSSGTERVGRRGSGLGEPGQTGDVAAVLGAGLNTGFSLGRYGSVEEQEKAALEWREREKVHRSQRASQDECEGPLRGEGAGIESQEMQAVDKRRRQRKRRRFSPRSSWARDMMKPARTLETLSVQAASSASGQGLHDITSASFQEASPSAVLGSVRVPTRVPLFGQGHHPVLPITAVSGGPLPMVGLGDVVTSQGLIAPLLPPAALMRPPSAAWTSLMPRRAAPDQQTQGSDSQPASGHWRRGLLEPSSSSSGAASSASFRLAYSLSSRIQAEAPRGSSSSLQASLLVGPQAGNSLVATTGDDYSLQRAHVIRRLAVDSVELQLRGPPMQPGLEGIAAELIALREREAVLAQTLQAMTHQKTEETLRFSGQGRNPE